MPATPTLFITGATGQLGNLVIDALLETVPAIEESDGDLMGDGVNIAARLEGIAKPGAICLSEQAYWQVKGRLDLAVSDLGPMELKNIAEPIRVYSLEVGKPAIAMERLENAADGAPASRISKRIPRSIMIWPRRSFGLPAARGGGGMPPHHRRSSPAAAF